MGVSTGFKLLLPTQPSCCACGFADPCLGGANNDSSPPSCEPSFCKSSSPLSEGLWTPVESCLTVEFVLRCSSNVSIRMGQLG